MSFYSKKCADVLGKILQILLIIVIALLIASRFISLGLKQETWIYLTIIVYILFLIAQFTSSTCSFLCNKTTENGIKIIMSSLVQTHPVIEFYCECYHYGISHVRYNPPKKGGRGKRGRRGGKRHGVRTKRRRITTYTETAIFPYYSARDVSGLFQLNKSREATMSKVYIKLELTPEINFADELSYMDYEYFRTDFYNRNRRRDKFMDYSETRKVPGLNNFNFVCIRDTEPCGVNICMFILFTILPFTELYKCYINSYCLEQKFKIRKLISTRYDLNQDQYQTFVPSFDLPTQQYAFEPSNYNYINSDYKVKNPTNEEISQAAMYKDKIPKYECVSYTSINDQIKVGVIQDDPAYNSVNINQAPPPSCQDIGPQPDNNNNNMDMNMNMNMNLNMNMNGMNNINSNNNINYNNNLNSNNNMNYNANYNNMGMNQDEDDDSDDEDPNNVGYSGA